jgi:hypothetical protein
MKKYTFSIATLLLILGQITANSDKHGARKRKHLRSLADRLDSPFLEAEPPRFSRSNDGKIAQNNMRAAGREIDRLRNEWQDRNREGDEEQFIADDGRPFDFDNIHLPSERPSSVPSQSPSVSSSTNTASQPINTKSPTFSPFINTDPSRVEPPQRAEICPLDQPTTSTMWHVEIHPDSNPRDDIEDDLAEISSMVFSAQTDAQGNRYAYAASDKAQFSVKVVKFVGQKKSGSVVATYILKNVDIEQSDWEDMSLGPCSGNAADNTTCIYMGNIGNNERPRYRVRKELEIYKFPEPIIGASGPTTQEVDVGTIAYEYESGRPLDGKCHRNYDGTTVKLCPNLPFSCSPFTAEAMFVDWNVGEGKGDIYILTKGSSCGHRLGVSRIPASEHANIIPGIKASIGETEMVLEDPPDCANSENHAWQGADMSRDGKLIALVRDKELANVHFFSRDTGQSVKQALEASPCKNVVQASGGGPNESKYESVAFLDDFGNQMAVVSECDGGAQCRAPVYVHDLEYEYTPGIEFNNDKNP